MSADLSGCSCAERWRRRRAAAGGRQQPFRAGDALLRCGCCVASRPGSCADVSAWLDEQVPGTGGCVLGDPRCVMACMS